VARRVIRPTPLFRERRKKYVTSAREAKALAATIAAIAEAERLPGFLDERAMMPPTRSAFVRQVAGYSLWLWYDATDAEIRLLTLSRVPPGR
jgi:hypothetical protein